VKEFTLLLQVRFIGQIRKLAETVVAIAGATATVASDALMNPFDGKYINLFPELIP